jgi:hypothetical protein
MGVQNALAQTAGIPIHFKLDKPGYVTLVIEDAQGRRVRNLISETLLPAGENTVLWDGYDEGTRIGSQGDAWERDLTRRRVSPGIYTVRGLIHDRLSLRYEFSVNSPGVPPWKTRDGSGGWLADHSPAGDILYLPRPTPAPNGKGAASFLVCSTSGETGDEFVWLSAEGRRLYGTNTGFWGGTHLARDPGPHAVPEHVAYTFISGERDPDNDRIEVRAFSRTGDLVPTAGITYPLELKKTTLPTFKTLAEAYGSDGLAAYNGIVVFSVTRQNRLVFANARTQQMIGEASVAAPRGMCFDAQGRLWIITAKQVRRYHVVPEQAQLHGYDLTLTGLEDPRRLALDTTGRIYVADWGRSNQVKLFTAGGRFVRAFGKPGGGAPLGRYDEQTFSHPCGMTVDAAGRLWVSEAENAPRRLSIWNTRSGALERAIYGPSQYGGGGKLDPTNPARLYMDPAWSSAGVTWRLDWEKGAAKPLAVYWRPDSPRVEAMPPTVPETLFRKSGFRFMVDSYNDGLRYNQDRGVGIWRLDADEIARPVAIIGNAADLINPIWGLPLRHRDAITALWKGLDPATVMYVWTDRNGDQIAEPDEIRFCRIPSPQGGGYLTDIGLGAQVLPDLSFVTTWGIHVAPPELDARGIPTYDLSKRGFIGDHAQYSERVPAGEHVVYTRVNSFGITGGRVDGSHYWSYQSTEGGQAIPGQLTEPTRLMGLPVTPHEGEAGPLFAFNSDKGGIYLLTMDGLYLQTLGGDARYTPLWRVPASETRRGMRVEGLSYGEEQFHPTIIQVEHGGAIYLVVGHEHSSIVRLEGLETVRRLRVGNTTVIPEQLALLPETRTEPARKTGRATLEVPLRTQEMPMDGRDWTGLNWVSLDTRASAAVLLTRNTLYAAWKTGDPDAINGGRGDYRYQFKHGGALDLMIGNPEADHRRRLPEAGDLRLLITRVEGKTRAVLYRPVAPEAPPGAAVVFDSPIGRASFDQVEDISGKVTLAASGTGDFKISVPLAALGLMAPAAGQEFVGDIGLLRGDGAQTTQRLYWNNQDTEMVSDVPGEARLQPGNWGIWKVVANTQQPAR